jgi:hypothetical protein
MLLAIGFAGISPKSIEDYGMKHEKSRNFMFYTEILKIWASLGRYLAKAFNLVKFKTSDRSHNLKHTIFKAKTSRKKEMCRLL